MRNPDGQAKKKTVMLSTTLLSCALQLGLSLRAGPLVTAPLPAQVAEYPLRTFTSQMSAPELDLEDGRLPGRKWFLGNWFGSPSATGSSLTFGSDGAVTINPLSGNASIFSASPTANRMNWVGMAFGGGAYIEATLRFDPRDVVAGTVDGKLPGWPAWWTLSLEHQIGTTLHEPYRGKPSKTDFLWDGQSSKPFGAPQAATRYAHFVEPDIFEYIFPSGGTRYYGTLHDWSGTWSSDSGWSSNVTQGYWNALKDPGADTDFRQYHRYGLLWIPATDTVPGLLRYYFDDRPMGADVRYDKYDARRHVPPVTSSTPWLFGVIDQQHLTLILSTSAGMPLTIKDVSVWQKDTSKNLVGGDTTAPTLAFANPSSGAIVQGLTTIAVDAGDDVALAEVELFADMQPVGKLLQAPFDFHWDTTRVANGERVLTAVAKDVAGHSVTRQMTVRVQNQPVDDVAPTIEVLSPRPNQRLPQRTLSIYSRARDNVGVVSVELYADGNFVSSSRAAPFTTRWMIPRSLPRGPHTVHTVAYDRAGNSAISAPITVYK